MMLRPQRWNDLRDNSPDSESGHTIITCENCGRMLFYDPARDSPQRKTVQSESIAAQIVRSTIKRVPHDRRSSAYRGVSPFATRQSRHPQRSEESTP